MTSLESPPIASTLERLHREADAADQQMIADLMTRLETSGETAQALGARLVAEEKADMESVYRVRHSEHFLAVSPAYGRYLYALARARGAARIVEFGTSMGVSTLYLAAALRDNGGGRLTGSEMVPSKVARARAHVAEAGLSDLVDIREGDALATLADVEGPVDLLLIDGAWSLYLPILKLIEPKLAPGAIILGENAFDPDFLGYVRDPANGYVSQPLAIDEDRGNEFAVRVG